MRQISTLSCKNISQFKVQINLTEIIFYSSKEALKFLANSKCGILFMLNGKNQWMIVAKKGVNI